MSRIELILNAILTGDTSELKPPKSRIEELLIQILEGGGGGGDLTGVVACLQDILALLRLATYTDDQQPAALLAQLEDDIAELSGDVAINYDGTTAAIGNLAGIGITYDGTTAVIGG